MEVIVYLKVDLNVFKVMGLFLGLVPNIMVFFVVVVFLEDDLNIHQLCEDLQVIFEDIGDFNLEAYHDV